MTLTLEQVLAARRDAFCGMWDLHFNDDGSIQATALESRLVPDAETWGDALVATLPFGGWHHLPGCDCEYCALPSLLPQTGPDRAVTDHAAPESGPETEPERP